MNQSTSWASEKPQKYYGSKSKLKIKALQTSNPTTWTSSLETKSYKIKAPLPKTEYHIILP